MNYRSTIALLFALLIISCNKNTIKREETQSLAELKFDQNETVTYHEAVEHYKKLADHYKEAAFLEYGLTDAGKPLHLFVMSNDGVFNIQSIKKSGRSVVLINNGIHPGEPEGIDASIWFADDVLRNHNNMFSLLDNTVICIIPVYSIGGALNRSAFHRTGQTTPREVGYRGNAQQLDLNRDFVKMDTKNAKAFAEIFRTWDPDVFLDTHTTNGTDHPYTITLIEYQPDALPKNPGNFFRNEFIPHLYAEMAKTDYEMIPYVNYTNTSPKDGLELMPQSPRFSTGYTGLFNTFSFMTENQIYKPFPDRVRSVYHFLIAFADFTNQHAETILLLRKEAAETISRQKEFVLEWKKDTSRFDRIKYRGYEGEIGISPITGFERFGFNREKPYDTVVPYFGYHLPALSATAPDFYILPSAWDKAVENLRINHVEMQQLAKDTTIEVERYHFSDVETSTWQNNGHRVHTKFTMERHIEKVDFYEGDYVIPMNQPANYYIVSVLEPEAPDSFFRWNFFDPCLEQREYFSSFGFEENAMNYLNDHPDFRKQFEEAVRNDPQLAANHRAQLAYIYDNTEWADNRKGRYPVVRINEMVKLPLK
jgi:hypothetical protein